MLVLCFAIFLGGWIPRLSPWGVPQFNSVDYQRQALEVASAGTKVWLLWEMFQSFSIDKSIFLSAS